MAIRYFPWAIIVIKYEGKEYIYSKINFINFDKLLFILYVATTIDESRSYVDNGHNKIFMRIYGAL